MLDIPALYVRGPYRVVDDPGARPDRRYVVLDPAGTAMHRAAGLDDACAWVDQRVPDLHPARIAAPRSR